MHAKTKKTVTDPALIRRNRTSPPDQNKKEQTSSHVQSPVYQTHDYSTVSRRINPCKHPESPDYTFLNRDSIAEALGDYLLPAPEEAGQYQAGINHDFCCQDFCEDTGKYIQIFSYLATPSEIYQKVWGGNPGDHSDLF